MAEKKNIRVEFLELNEGQLYGLPKNPRWIRDARYKALKKSIQDAPEMLDMREILVYPLTDLEGHEDKYIVIGGNMRFRACKELGYTELPCKVIPLETPVKKLREYVIKDNEGFGQNDWEALANDWDADELLDFGAEVDYLAPSSDEDADNMDEDLGEDPEDDGREDEQDEEQEDEAYEFGSEFADKMYRDVLYPANNDFEIPTLDIEMQAGRLELPLSPWGAEARSRTQMCTYHFYVDDYRFNRLFKDPAQLLASGCKAIVEPNCSLHDQTPIAFGLNQIYKKRYLARYCQEVGIKVYADLNVAEKFRPYNKMGIPKGYNAFATRGLDGWMESLANDLKDAQEISGLEAPNLLVYGGGKEVKQFCQEHGLLYVSDFINAKKL